MREVALAPVGALLRFAWGGWLVILLGVPIAAITIFFSGERLGWPSTQSWIAFGCTCGFIALVAVVGQCAELLFSDRIERVWIADARCLEVSRLFGERLIARDVAGAFALLATERQSVEPIDEFHAAVESFWKDAGESITVENVTEDRLEEDYNSGDFETELESGSSFVAVTEVRFSQPGGATGGENVSRILTIYLSLEREQYRVLDFRERS